MPWPPALPFNGEPLGEVDVQSGGPYQAGHLPLRFAVAVVETIDVQQRRPGVVLALEHVVGRIQGAQPQEGKPGVPSRLRFLSLLDQDQGVGGPLRGAPRLLRRVPDLPLVEHLEGVVVECPRVGEEESDPVGGYHVLRASRVEFRWATSDKTDSGLTPVCV